MLCPNCGSGDVQSTNTYTAECCECGCDFDKQIPEFFTEPPENDETLPESESIDSQLPDEPISPTGE